MILQVIQRRYDGSVDFYRSWADYESGFGSINTELWLGMLEAVITRYMVLSFKKLIEYYLNKSFFQQIYFIEPGPNLDG